LNMAHDVKTSRSLSEEETVAKLLLAAKEISEELRARPKINSHALA